VPTFADISLLFGRNYFRCCILFRISHDVTQNKNSNNNNNKDTTEVIPDNFVAVFASGSFFNIFYNSLKTPWDRGFRQEPAVPRS
jgi:hypothetical protein